MMRSLLSLTVALALMPVDARDEPKAIIDKAIAAHGGATVLDKYPAGRLQKKGTITLQGTEFPFTSQSVYLLPDSVRTTSEITAQGVRRSATQVFSNRRLSIFVGGLAQQVPTSQTDEVKMTLYVQNLLRMTPLVKENRYKLAELDEKTVDGKTAVGIKVSSEGARDVSLYFDKNNSLLVLVERPGFDAAGKAVTQQEFYSNFREANGLKYPTKTVIRQNDQRYLESETTEFKPLERVDAREFTHVP
jgi:hypothetical protein